jgi:hypothetical protein
MRATSGSEERVERRLAAILAADVRGFAEIRKVRNPTPTRRFELAAPGIGFAPDSGCTDAYG